MKKTHTALLMVALLIAALPLVVSASDCREPVRVYPGTDTMLAPGGETCVILYADAGTYRVTLDRPAHIKVTQDPCWQVGPGEVVAETDMAGDPWEFVNTESGAILWIQIDVAETAVLNLIVSPHQQEVLPDE